MRSLENQSRKLRLAKMSEIKTSKENIIYANNIREVKYVYEKVRKEVTYSVWKVLKKSVKSIEKVLKY